MSRDTGSPNERKENGTEVQEPSVKEPTDAEKLICKAVMLLAVDPPPTDEQIREALEALTEATSKDPECGAAFFAIGKCQEFLGHHLEAAGAFERAVDTMPSVDEMPAEFSIQVWCRLGESYTRLERYSDASNAFQSALSLQRHTGMEALGRDLGPLPDLPAETLEAVEQMLKSQWSYYRACAHAGMGYVWEVNDDHEQAVQEYRKAIEIFPDYPSARHRLGVALHAQGRTDEALECLQDLASSEGEGRAFGHLGMAGIFWDQGRHEESLAAYEAAHRADPNLIEAQVGIGGANMNLGRYADALAVFEQALASQPESPDALSRKASCLYRLGRYEEAATVFDQIVEAGCDDPDLMVEAGCAYAECERHDQAVEVLENALRLDPNADAAHAWLGYCLSKLGRLEEAQLAYSEAVKQDPDDDGIRGALQDVLAEIRGAQEGTSPDCEQ